MTWDFRVKRGGPQNCRLTLSSCRGQRVDFPNSTKCLFSQSEMCDSQDFINLIVGGLHYCLSPKDIKSCPDSYFTHLLKDEWNDDKSKVVHLDRDGKAFRYIHYYMITGYLDTSKQRIQDFKILLAVKREADFYNLPGLIRQCNARITDFNEDFCHKILPKVAPFELYDCVSESEAAPTDPLLLALSPLRNSYIATARLSTYADDQLDDPTRPLTELPSEIRTAVDIARGAPRTKLTMNCLCYFTWLRIRDSFAQKWPFTPHKQLSFPDVNVFIMCKGEAYHDITQRNDLGSCAGTILYVFNSEFAGGKVSATVNGQTVSINQPGECMALQPGVSYNIDTVTDGELVLLEMVAWSGQCRSNANAVDVEWVLHQPDQREQWNNQTIPPAIADSILSCVDDDLIEYSGVVLCLSKYYRIRVPSDSNRLCETDPDSLCGSDKSLLCILEEHYDVNVVSVYICRERNCQHILNSCVVDFLIHDAKPTNTERTVDRSIPKSEMCKIVSPLYGYGERFCSSVLQCLTDSGGDGGESERISTVDAWCTLLTGLLVTRKTTV